MTTTEGIFSDIRLVLLNLQLSSRGSSVGLSSSRVYMLKQINVMLRHALQDMFPDFLEQLTLRDNPREVIALNFFLSVLVLIIRP